MGSDRVHKGTLIAGRGELPGTISLWILDLIALCELLICMIHTLFKHYKSMQKSGVWVFLYSFHSSSQNYLISIGKLLHTKHTLRTHISIP